MEKLEPNDLHFLRAPYYFLNKTRKIRKPTQFSHPGKNAWSLPGQERKSNSFLGEKEDPWAVERELANIREFPNASGL